MHDDEHSLGALYSDAWEQMARLTITCEPILEHAKAGLPCCALFLLALRP